MVVVDGTPWHLKDARYGAVTVVHFLPGAKTSQVAGV